MPKETIPLKKSLESLLWRRLFLPFVGTALLSLALVSYFSGNFVEAQQLRYAQYVGYSAAQFIEHAADNLEAIEQIIAQSSLVSSQKHIRAIQNSHSFFDTIYYIGADKKIKTMSPYDARYDGLDMSRNEYFQGDHCGSDIAFSVPFTSLRTGQPTAYMTRCTAAGEYLVGELSLASLQQNISRANANTGTVFIVDQNGALLAHPDFHMVAQHINVGNWKIVQQGLRGNASLTYWRDGNLWVGSASRMEDSGWAVISEVSAARVYAPYIGLIAAVSAVFILIFAIAVRVFLLQLERKLVAPLVYLTRSVDTMASGDYTASEAAPDDTVPFMEVSRLLTNFRAMRQTIFSRESDLRNSERQYRYLVENSPDAILLHSDGVILYANAAAAQLYAAASVNEITGKSVLSFVHEESQLAAQARLEKVKNKEQALPLVELKNVRLDGSVFTAETITFSVFLAGTCVAQTIIRDITRRKSEEEMLKYRATHDPLTDLPNRFLAQDRLQHALANSRRNQTLCAVLYLDMDNFKSINDSFGHNMGDQTLQWVAKILQGAVREGDTVARMSGDEFIVLLENLKETKDAEQVAANINRAFAQPYTIDGEEARISFSIGISVFPKDGASTEELIQFADAAMYDAKREGKRRAKLYAPFMRARSLERISLQNELSRALERNQLFLQYQPQVRYGTSDIIGVEALLRWRHPSMGLIAPSRFIPIAEETGLILPIGEWVLRSALAQARAWELARFDDLRVAVNLSDLQFKQPDVSLLLKDVITETGVSPHMLEIELTEDIIFREADFSFDNLENLRRTGVALAMDDFGAGFSTLGNLAHIPFNRIKIDQRLVSNIQNPKDAAVVSGIIAICNNLNLEIVAEGVETQSQLNFCAQQGCDLFQGWYYSPAVDAEQITRYLQQGVPWQP